jgi:hypothetical protein
MQFDHFIGAGDASGVRANGGGKIGSREWVLAAALFAVSLVARAAFMLRGGMADADSVAIAAGLARTFSSRVSFGDCILYGRQMSPGMYLAFKLLHPLVMQSPAQVIPLLNWFGVISASLVVLPLYLVFRRSLNVYATAGAIVLFSFSPLVWETGISFHPILPSMLLFLFACLSWGRVSAPPQGSLWFAATCLLASGAVTMRMEILMAVPAVVAAVLLYGKWRKDVPLLAVVLAIAIGTHILVAKALPGSNRTAGKGVADFIRYFLQLYRETLSIGGVVKTASWFVMGAGVGTIALVAVGLLSFLRNRIRVRGLIVALSLAMPALVFWLVQPGGPILRHYYYVMPAVAWIAVAFLPGRLTRGLVIILVTATVVCNLAIPEAAYRIYNSRHPASIKTPNGTFFCSRHETEERIARYRDLQAKVLALARSGVRGEVGETPVGGGGAEAGQAPGAFIPVNWETYAYVLYGLAQDERLVKSSETVAEAGVFLHRYRIGNVEVRMIFSDYFSWRSLPEAFGPFLGDAAKEGCTVFLPRELLAPGAATLPPGASYIAY